MENRGNICAERGMDGPWLWRNAELDPKNHAGRGTRYSEDPNNCTRVCSRGYVLLRPPNSYFFEPRFIQNWCFHGPRASRRASARKVSVTGPSESVRNLHGGLNWEKEWQQLVIRAESWVAKEGELRKREKHSSWSLPRLRSSSNVKKTKTLVRNSLVDTSGCVCGHF